MLAGALVPVVQQHSQAARALSNELYAHERRQADVFEPFTPTGTALPAPEKIYQYVQWALQPVLDAPKTADVTALLDTAQKNAGAGLAKLVADVGRQQVVDDVMADPRASAWAREARPDACWFCAMLATRGAVYRSAWAAGRRRYNGVNSNSYHLHCHCHVVPVFGQYEAPAHIRQWQSMYLDATKDVHGANKAWAFQQAYLGREVKHKTKKWSGYGKKRKPAGRVPKSREDQVNIAAGMSDDRARQALDRARELYAQEGDPVGDRVSWIKVLEDRLGQSHAELPAARNLLDTWDDQKLQAALDTARRLLADKGDPHGMRQSWIDKLENELKRRAASV